MSASTQTAGSNAMLRWSVILAIALVAFFASYRYAIAQSASSQPAASGLASSAGGKVSGGGGCCGSGGTGGSSAAAAPVAPSTAAPAATTGGGGCCGGGASGPATTKAAEVSGDVQKITVDLSKGYYDPSIIELKAGVPAEITFGQSGGCTGQVQSQGLGFAEDLTSGPKTVKLKGLAAGTYSFACGMNMVSGSIVVK